MHVFIIKITFKQALLKKKKSVEIPYVDQKNLSINQNGKYTFIKT